ncbi:MAG: ABC transporter substrate-binding protein [Planctomycetota bacterium]
MTRSIPPHSILPAILLAVICALGPEDRGLADEGHTLPDGVQRGRAIYHAGEGRPPIDLLLSSSDLTLPATTFPCSNCHGGRGEGTEEGGVAPPPIRWRDLLRPATSPLTGVDRPAHTAESVLRAITEGVDPTGRPLHPGMPRYTLTEEQGTDLVSYLRILGSDLDLDPGLTAERVRLGCFLPLSGPRAERGEAVRRALEAFVANSNGRGGVYGRTLEVVYADSGETEESAVEAARRLIEEDEVFALLACFVPVGAEDLYLLVEEAGVPLVAPLTIPPRPQDPPLRTAFQLLSGHYEQARVLVEFAAVAPELPKAGYSLVFIDDGVHREARDGVVDQIAVFGGALAAELSYPIGELAAEEVVALLAERKTEAVLMFGVPGDIIALAVAMDEAGVAWPLLTTGSTLGRAAFSLPETVARGTYVTYPSGQPTQEELQWVLDLAAEQSLVIDHPAQQGPALAAARIFVEGLKRSGKRVSRDSWTEAIEGLKHFRTGLAPPVSFGLNQRTGALGASILRIEPQAESFLPVSDWITPRSKDRTGARALGASREEGE